MPEAPERDPEMLARVQELADLFDRSGFLVTSRYEVEAAGVSWLSGYSVQRLRKERYQLDGPPPSRTVRRVALYGIADLLRWIDEHREGRCVLSESEASRSE